MDSLFSHKENFITSLEDIETTEIDENVYKDDAGKIYAWAFGGQKYTIYDNVEIYLKSKGKITYFSIDSVSSSFINLENNDIEEILSKYEIIKVAKKINKYETAYYLSNGEIIMFDNNKITGILFKNINEMNLILS